MDVFARTFDSEFVVCSIDVGTATSSMSIVHVKKGDNMQTLHDKVYRVKKWSYHKQRTADIPTALCYRNGEPIDRKMGANAKPPGPGEDWVVVKNFKRHVAKLGSNDTSNLGSLPAGVSLAKVYEDWLKFVFKSGSESFADDFEIPENIWDRRMVVFVAPNGWTETEKANVRKILHRARCVEYDDHVRFARESEATFHYCLYHGLDGNLSTPVGLEFFICNAGAATTDLGFYKVTSTDMLQFSEVLPAISLDGGSLYENTPGVTDYNTVNLIETTVRNMRTQASASPKFLILGGGFANNQAVQDQLSKNLKSLNIQVDAPFQKPSEFGVEESPTVDGALYSLLWNYVSTRAAALTYGTNVLATYNSSNAEHVRRIANATYEHAGTKYVNYSWENIVRKGDLIRDGEKTKHAFRQLFNYKPTENQIMSFTLYGAANIFPSWLRQEDGSKLTDGVREICTVTGPIHINDVTINEVKWGPNNSNTAYEIPYHFDIDFGSVTSQANIVWTGKNEKPAFAPATFHPPHDSEVLWGNL